MSREILVVTPENIEIEYELAGVGTRFLANMLDTFLQLAIYLALWIVVGITASVIALGTNAVSAALGQFFAQAEIAFAVIAGFAIWWGYFIWFETAWNGQTPGDSRPGRGDLARRSRGGARLGTGHASHR